MKRAFFCAMFVLSITMSARAQEEEFELLKHEIIKLAAPRAKITAQQAIETASKQAADAKLAGLELSLEGDTPDFELGFLMDKGEKEVKVDAVSGKVIQSVEEKPNADEEKENSQTSKALGASKMTVVQAIEVAMKAVKGGTVVAAKAEVEEGMLEFEVEMMVGDSFKEVKLDADGKLKEVEDEKPEGQVWTFDREDAGKAPPHWKFGYTNPADGKGTWRVVKDAKSISGPNVLELKAESGGRAFNLAMAADTSYEDVDVRARLRPNTGKEDQGGGLIWRCKDVNNYYICRMNPLESNFRVYHVINGKREQLQSVNVKTQPGKWYVVRAKMVGDHIMCWLDEKKLLDVTDDSIRGVGMIGLWTKADASSSFDNIAVRKGRMSKDMRAESKEMNKQAPGEKQEERGGDKDDNDDDDDD